MGVTLADGSKGGFAYNALTGAITVSDLSKLVAGKTYALAFTALDSSANPSRKPSSTTSPSERNKPRKGA